MSRILVVDDDPTSQLLLSYMLNRTGYEAILSNDGIEALKLLEQDAQFDVIVSDIHMPKMDGFQFLDELTSGYPHIPVIISSVHTNPEIVDEITKRGAAFLPRPFTCEALTHAVKSVTLPLSVPLTALNSSMNEDIS